LISVSTAHWTPIFIEITWWSSIALDPGSFPPLPKTFVELPGLSNIFLFELDYANPWLIAAGLWVNPSKNGCLRA